MKCGDEYLFFPRFIRDFDFIIHLQLTDVKSLVDYFKEGYYCNEDAVKDAIITKSNVQHCRFCKQL